MNSTRPNSLDTKHKHWKKNKGATPRRATPAALGNLLYAAGAACFYAFWRSDFIV